ncbi:MAG: sulfite exporter TauE/SafE family protein [Myxococcales bacterium]|nr:sulfite exporter TauE/SafE family protein [Myxococcales bacterium]
MLGPPTFEAALYGCAIVAVGSALQGAVGFGLALMTAPILVLISPELVPGPLCLAATFLVALTAWRDRAGIDVRGVGWSLVGRVPGAAAGAALLSAVSIENISLIIGAAVLLAVAMSASGAKIRPTRVTLLSAGVVSGAMGTASAIGGPPMAMVYQHEDGETLRGTLAGYILVGSVVTLTALHLVGKFAVPEVIWGLALMPGAVVGFAVSAPLARYLDRGRTRAAVLATSAAAGLILLARTLL